MPVRTENSATPSVIYAGGTIGCTGRPLVPLPGPDFAARAAAAGLSGGARWRWTGRAIDSAEATPADWLALGRMVAEADGPAVILHGTDTLAWSAAALALLTTGIGADGAALARWPHPVVLTGSQRPLFGPDGAVDRESDAPANLRLALAAARGDPGVRVAFGGRVMPGARVRKAHTSADDAFAAEADRPLPALPPTALGQWLDRLAPHFGARIVLAVAATPGGAEAEWLAAAAGTLGERLGAVHLLGYGLGTFPGGARLGPLFAGLAARGVLVVAGTQVPSGGTDPGLYGAGSWLADAGAVPAGAMTVPATQAKLHLTLALAALHRWDRETAAAFLSRPVAGET